MTAIRSRDKAGSSIEPGSRAGGLAQGSLTAASIDPETAVPGVVWYDLRDRVWRGVAPSLSLFAEADTREEVGALLTEKVSTYLQDAREQGLERELVPRPLSRGEWRKLRLYFRTLEARARLARLIFPAQSIPAPIVSRIPVYWHG